MILEQYFVDNNWRKETDENEDATVYHYYALDLADGFSFISSSNDEVKDNAWTVRFFDCYPSMKFNDTEQLDVMIKIAIDAMELGKEDMKGKEQVEFNIEEFQSMIRGFMIPSNQGGKYPSLIRGFMIPPKQ
tara:strand:+ start:286 stop:681 length:396 start_codon:yes stop_codon:yes gene_type:complete